MLDDETAARYLTFAAEARGHSPAYESLALSVATDHGVLGRLGTLPAQKRQPNLLFAAARFLLGEPADIGALRSLASDRWAELSEIMLARRTQTNEPTRCALMLPAFGQIRGPLALLEVGASAGLTLLPDRYSYDFSGRRVTGTDHGAPVLSCSVSGPAPVPGSVPEVVWRAGLDLNPLDIGDDDHVRWLQCLVWPGEGDRAERLAAAIDTARRDPPAVYRGDMITGLPALAAQAPAGATLVIYHTSALVYLPSQRRREFAETVRGLGAVWLAGEAPGVVPGVPHDENASENAGVNAAGGSGVTYLISRDGRERLAAADSHGWWLRWLMAK